MIQISWQALARQREESRQQFANASSKVLLYQTVHSVIVSGTVFEEYAHAKQSTQIVDSRISRLAASGQLPGISIKAFARCDADSD